MSSAAGRPLRLAATLILRRAAPAGPDVRVWGGVARSDDRSSGAWVFPGGTLDAQDRELHALCAGLDDVAASRGLGLAAGGLDLHVAAMRECFEEAGLLIARGPGGHPIAGGASLRELRSAGADLSAACATLGARLTADRLVYCAHWITPLGVPKRFDTRFFVAEAPAGQEVLLARDELSDHAWVTPQAALADTQRFHLVPVTRRVLQSIAGFTRVQECLDHFRQLAHIPVVQPWRALGAAGSRVVMPWDPSYAEVVLLDPEGRGQAWCELRPYEPTALLGGLWRVPGPQGNAYLLRLASGDWVVVDGEPDCEPQLAALRASAGGAIRWAVATSSTAAAWKRAAAVAAQTGAALLSPNDARQLFRIVGLGDRGRGLVSTDGQVLFSGCAPDGAPAEWHATLLRQAHAAGLAAPRWIAPGQGFLAACAEGAG